MDKADDESWKAYAMHQKKRADDAERERDAALAVLRELEWTVPYAGAHQECTYCGELLTHRNPIGHKPDCALAACLNGGA